MQRFAWSGRLRREGVILAFTAALAALAVVAVFSLHDQADQSRQAQIRLATVATAAQEVATVPLVALYQSLPRGRSALNRAERTIERELSALARSAPNPDLVRIRGSAKTFSQDIGGILTLIALVNRPGTAHVGSLPSPSLVPTFDVIQRRFEREYKDVSSSIRAASNRYRDAASAANVEAYVGSALAIVLSFLFFAGAVRGLARARRRTERLAAENARLLELSREEANTDPLTGLPNRRKLMRDLEESTQALEPGQKLSLVLFDLDGFKQYNDSFGHPAGDRLLVRLGTRLAETIRPYGVAYRMGGDEFCTVCRLDHDGDEQSVIEAARNALAEHGDGFCVSSSYGVALLPSDATDCQSALRLADKRLYAHKSFSPMRPTMFARDMLLQALVERSPDLGVHLANVADLSERLALRLGLGPVATAQVRLAAELHDIGKVAMPEAILSKPSGLTDEEWLLIKQHTLIGERIVGAAGSSLDGVAELIRWSHERPDGTGYPDGLAGDAIPLGARIIAVCDAYDAMLAQRPYRSALTTEEALTELHSCSGSQFDPVIVREFVALVLEQRRGLAVSA